MFEIGDDDKEGVGIKNLFIAINGIPAGDEVHKMLEDVEMVNKEKNLTIDGVKLANHSSKQSEGSFQVYRFDNLKFTQDEKWELRADVIDNGAGKHPSTGDQFRVLLCSQPTHVLSNGVLKANETGCEFPGLEGNSLAYQMQVYNLFTGDKVADVSPQMIISGNFHKITSSSLSVAVKSIGTEDGAVENQKNIKHSKLPTQKQITRILFWTKINHRVYGQFISQLLLYNPLLCPL